MYASEDSTGSLPAGGAGVAALPREAGAIYTPGRRQPDAVRPLERHDAVVSESYFFALDAEGRPAWPFRHLHLATGRVFVQRWRLGRWIYSRDLDALWDGADDRWTETTRAAVDGWIGRSGPFGAA
jgi:hypothetical protein